MRIYFMGIGGAGMGNAAVLLHTLGHDVIGADGPIYSPMAEVLQEANITTYEGYNPQRLQALAPDLIVVGNVVSRGNPEVEWLLENRSIPYLSLPALMAHELLQSRFNIVITGTHGKTTTTTLTASLLHAHGQDCGYFIGGVPLGLPSGSHIGSISAPFVIEGDEYDSAFFDKRSKFIHYLPSILVLNNLELDHTDIFRDLEDIKKTFSHVTRLVPRKGAILANGDNPNVCELLTAISWTNVYTVGVGKGNDLQIANFKEDISGSQFTLIWQGKVWADVKTKLPSLFNARNTAMASLATALYLYPQDPTQLDLKPLSQVQGAKRRQEILSQNDQTVIIEDFAHHPTAIKETLESLRQRYPGYTLTACFEPRSNTATTNVLQKEFTEALSIADQILIGAIHRKETIPEATRLNTDKIVRAINTKKTAQAFDSNEALKIFVNEYLSSQTGNQLVIFFSNGTFGGILSAFKEQTAMHSPVAQ